MADHLGTFEQAVLLAIVRLDEEAYGRAILKEVQRRSGRAVAAGAVHATLERLEKKAIVSSRLGPGTPIRGGRPRRFYRLRAKGFRALNDARGAVDSLWQGLEWPLKGPAWLVRLTVGLRRCCDCMSHRVFRNCGGRPARGTVHRANRVRLVRTDC